MAVLAINTIGNLPITSKANRWALTTIFLDTSCVFRIVMKEKSAENVVQSYFTGIIAHEAEV